jgi:PIN domain nuclease of toxin-antitoxin system
MTGYLLDTQVLLWAGGDARRLSAEAAEIVSTAQSVVASTISIAEIVIKQSVGKLAMSVSALDICSAIGLEVLALDAADCMRLASVPLLHRDPFDRLLIAQALRRDLTVVTSDEQIWQYPGLSVVRT